MGTRSRVQEGRGSIISPHALLLRWCKHRFNPSILQSTEPSQEKSADEVQEMGAAKGETLICRISVYWTSMSRVLSSSWAWLPLSFLFHPGPSATPCDQSSSLGDQAGLGARARTATQPQSMLRSMLVFETQICGIHFVRGHFPQLMGTPGAAAFFPLN